jgi:hypothetical protein
MTSGGPKALKRGPREYVGYATGMSLTLGSPPCRLPPAVPSLPHSPREPLSSPWLSSPPGRPWRPCAARPGAPGQATTWNEGDKDGFGTAVGTASKVWYTLADGELTDVYFPRIDTPSIRDSQFVVTDGATFTDREDRDSTHRVTLLKPDSLTYQITNTAKSGAWRIT